MELNNDLFQTYETFTFDLTNLLQISTPNNGYQVQNGDVFTQPPYNNGNAFQVGDWINDKNKSVTFSTNLTQAISNRPHSVKVKNAIASVYATSGYILEVRIPKLFNTPIYIMDGEIFHTDLQSNYFKGKQLSNQIDISVRRITGGDFTNTISQIKFITNPKLCLTLEYNYYPDN